MSGFSLCGGQPGPGDVVGVRGVLDSGARFRFLVEQNHKYLVDEEGIHDAIITCLPSSAVIVDLDRLTAYQRRRLMKALRREQA